MSVTKELAHGNAHRKYLLGVLLVILAFNYVDRLTLGLLLQSIKVDLQLTDTQLGLLSGIAFALFYSIMGIPIARWADRGNRVAIISLTTAVWSVAVAACGIAGNFLHLLLIRVAVAVGEAGCIPPAHSLIADYFSREERPRAVATYMLGWPLSVVIGYFLAGWLNELYGWRVTFVLLGSVGLILAPLAWFTLREPRRLVRPENISKQPQPPGMTEVFTTLWGSKSFRHLTFSFAIAYFFGYGILQWQPAFFIRSYGMQTGTLGTWFAVIWGVGGLLGIYWGGELAARRAAHNERLQLKATAVAYASFAILSACIYLSRNPYLGLGCLALATVGLNMTNGPLFATLQTLVPERMRAVSIAIVLLVANLIGMGLGPLAAGALSDALRPWLQEESLRYALLALCPGYLWGAWHLWQASRTVTGDVAMIGSAELAR